MGGGEGRAAGLCSDHPRTRGDDKRGSLGTELLFPGSEKSIHKIKLLDEVLSFLPDTGFYRHSVAFCANASGLSSCTNPCVSVYA